MGMLYEKQLLLSIGALFGTVCGMVIGQQIRRHIPEGLFRKIFKFPYDPWYIHHHRCFE